MHLRTLLAECAKKLNQYGPDSPEVEEFIRKNNHVKEFVELAELARTLKREVLQRNRDRQPGNAYPRPEPRPGLSVRNPTQPPGDGVSV